MNAETFIKNLVTEIEPNATVVGIEESQGAYHVSVIADCALPCEEVAAAEHGDDARRRVASVLKRCADDVVAPVPDGRG